jgi:recombination protein RecA
VSEQETFLNRLNKDMGAEAFLKLGKNHKKVTAGLSSGSFLLNFRLSGNPLIGYDYGRIIEIYGPEQSGKTTLALHAIAEAHKLDALKTTKQKLFPVFIDAEHALDPGYAGAIGVDLDNLYILQPDSGEQALTGVEKAIDNGSKLIVVDSVAALVPQAEIEGDMGDSHMGLHARLMSQALRKLTGKVSKTKSILIFINQIRMKLGVMYGNPETTTGGKALKFYSSYRLEVRSARGDKREEMTSLSDIKSEKSEVGILSSVKIVKNKVYPPFKKAKIPIIYGKGIDRQEDLLSYLDICGFLEQGIDLPSIGKTYKKKSAIIKVLDNPGVQKDLLEYLKKGSK